MHFAMSKDSADRIVLAGYLYNGTDDFAIVRLTPAGAFDSSFDGDGIQTIAFGPGDEDAECVAVDA